MTSGAGNILASIGATPEELLAEMLGPLSQWLTDTLASGSIQLVSAVKAVFNELEAKVATIVDLRADRLEVKEGVTLIDRTTGLPHCFYIDNGITVSTPGACGGEISEPAITDSQELSDGGVDDSENDGVVSEASFEGSEEEALRAPLSRARNPLNKPTTLTAWDSMVLERRQEHCARRKLQFQAGIVSVDYRPRLR